MKLPVIALTTLLLLTACETATSSGGLTVIEYTKEVQNKAAQEMLLGLSPTLNMMMNDYSVLRDQARIR